MSEDTLYIDTEQQVSRNPNFFEHIHNGDYELSTHILSDAGAVKAFLRVDNLLQDMMDHLGKVPEIASKDDFWFISIFFQVAKRELRNAFWLGLRRMTYDGMLILRVALESSKFGYMIHKDPTLSGIWVNKAGNRKAYTKAFRRKENIPDEMPFKEELETFIETIGDFWMHPHIGYFSSTVEITSREYKVHSLDPDPKNYYLCMASIFHACVMVLGIWGKTYEDRFVVYMTSKQQEMSRAMREADAVEKHYKKMSEQPQPTWKGKVEKMED